MKEKIKKEINEQEEHKEKLREEGRKEIIEKYTPLRMFLGTLIICIPFFYMVFEGRIKDVGSWIVVVIATCVVFVLTLSLGFFDRYESPEEKNFLRAGKFMEEFAYINDKSELVISIIITIIVVGFIISILYSTFFD